jgi:hypothetical protein
MTLVHLFVLELPPKLYFFLIANARLRIDYVAPSRAVWPVVSNRK